MRKERRIRVLRRVAVGLAVAAFVAPAAQARVDELGAGTQGTDGSAVIQGDDQWNVGAGSDSTAYIVGDDKKLAPDLGDYGLADYRHAVPTDYPNPVLVGDDKVIVPAPADSTVLIHGDDKKLAPDLGDYGLADYRHAVPTDYPNPVLVGDDKVIVPAPADSTVLIHGDDKKLAPDFGDRPAVPVSDLSSPNTFDWGDAFVGAGVAFALLLLAGSAALGTRRRGRPAAV